MDAVCAKPLDLSMLLTVMNELLAEEVHSQKYLISPHRPLKEKAAFQPL